MLVADTFTLFNHAHCFSVLSVCLCFLSGAAAMGRSLLLRDAANEDRILERAFAFFDKDGNGEIDVAELR
jgi:hypothetical protein